MGEYDCLVAARGYGTRFNLGMPKSLIDVDEVPLLRLQLKQLNEAGFRRIFVANNNKAWSSKIKRETDRFSDVVLVEDDGFQSTLLLCRSLAADLTEQFLFT
ncbi:NTP transferase domain-containing protein [Roseobacter sp.]|uniref:NTP transferase domain-containing protein n=1 Tax=Roseobacter sp. TaxID=1907202 RepID=UPI00329798B2